MGGGSELIVAEGDWLDYAEQATSAGQTPVEGVFLKVLLLQEDKAEQRSHDNPWKCGHTKGEPGRVRFCSKKYRPLIRKSS